jgi:hypothetical protein
MKRSANCPMLCTRWLEHIKVQLGRGGFDLLGQFFQQRFNFTVAFFDLGLVEAVCLQALA